MKRILIVDDQKEVLNVLNKLIAHLGHEGIITDDWQHALEVIKTEPIDLVLLDIHMPGRDGFLVAKDIHSAKPSQKIAIMTGLDPETVFAKLQAEEVDFDELIYKPFNFHQIQQILHRLLSC